MRPTPGRAGSDLLDTNILIDRHRYTFDPSEEYGASILSCAELELGIAVAKDPETRNRRVRHLVALDEVFDWVPFDISCTTCYGVITAGARPPGGGKIRGKDAMIAAQAHRFGADVLTANVRDFACFAHLITVIAPKRR